MFTPWFTKWENELREHINTFINNDQPVPTHTLQRMNRLTRRLAWRHSQTPAQLIHNLIKDMAK